MINFFTSVVISFVLSAVAGVFLIPLLHRLKFGQEIREEGPKWHKSKSGTPTMGGFIFIIAFVITAFGYPFITNNTGNLKEILFISVSALAFGAIGFLDDYIKVILKRNLGLTAAQKFSMQTLAALVFTALMAGFGIIDTSVLIPFTGTYVDIGYLVLPLDVLVMLATVNSVNLTDGLDGLAATVTVIVALFFAVIAEKLSDSVVMTVSAALCGGLLGFLLYNKYPARVFMGDTGSLFLGGLLASAAVYMRNPFILLIVGFVYVAEALSVIIQVTYFKKTGKRIFKMSPIHHHFEMCGYSEKKIVFLFSAVTLILCFIGYFGI